MNNTTPSAFPDWLERTALLYGTDALTRIQSAHVLVVGTGGVGAYAAEMICRAGVGALTLVDADTVATSNINRQLPALHSTVGQRKVEVLAARLLDINPNLNLQVRASYLTPEDMHQLLTTEHYSFVVDAIDTIAPKVSLIATALRLKQRIVSSMGAGAKTDVTQIRQVDLWATSQDGLAKAVRNGLTRCGLRGRRLPVVFCAQAANRKAIVSVEGERNKKTTAGTVSFMPATFGCFLAAYVLNHI